MIIFSTLIFPGLFSPPIVEGEGGGRGSRSLSGYAWSSNIGWISFEGSNPDYGVTLSGADATRDFAWSSNIGWISFESDTGTPPSGNAGVSLIGDKLVGWARACSVYPAGTCAGDALRPDSERGGWDGWIKLGDQTTDCDSDPNGRFGACLNASNQLDGFAWGADVVGWIDFCADPAIGACVTVDSLNVQCSATDANLDERFNVGEDVTWTATVTTGGLTTYCWGTGCTPPLGGSDVVGTTETVLVAGGYPTIGPVTARVRATQGTKTGEGVCSINVEDLNNPTLTVYVNGGTMGQVNVEPNPDTGLIDGCQTNDGSCNGTYALGLPVTLTADPLPNPLDPPNDYEFAWISGCDSNPTPDTCTVTMNGPRSVTITFDDQTVVEDSVNLSSSPSVLRINSHSEGQEASTEVATIIATISGNPIPNPLTGAKLCLDSFVSNSFNITYRGQSIYDIISVPPYNPDDKPICALSGLDGSFAPKCGAPVPLCAEFQDIGAGEYKVTFQVKVPKKLNVIANASPYKINFIVQGDNLTGNLTIPFIYRTGSGGP
ncbi:MAG: hypothetical protein HYT47_00715 [Candidatus Vogelbacteria bacterium]|nr:hypothetical protein [Candidatus Vogelbacteria bacterium]